MKLTSQQLRRQISPELVKAPASDSLERTILGQQRASEALEFGIAMERPGYNLYLAGDTGTGRTHYIREYLKPFAAHGKTPNDWLYVNNFETPSEPRCISLPHGMGKKFLRDIEQLIEELLASFPDAFENPAYIQQRTALQNHFNQRYDQALSVVEKAAAQKSIAVYRENGAITFGIIADGQIAEDAYFSQMNDEEREQFQQDVRQLEVVLNEALMELPKWQREVNKQLQQLLQQTIKQTLKPLFEDIAQKYQGHAGVQIYLAQMQQHLPRAIEEIFISNEEQRENAANQRKILNAYFRPNLLNRQDDQQGAPIVLPTNPNYNHLFGSVNIPTQAGENYHYHQAISAGAIHQANGGYLIVDVEKLLVDPRSWISLKRILRDNQHSIDAALSEANASPCHIKPQAIDIQLKVILIGSRDIYYALMDADSEFKELFRVLVDFDNYFALNEQSLQQFACLLRQRAKDMQLAQLSDAALACVAEYACRLSEHQQRLTTQIGFLLDILTEANYWCEKQHDTVITAEHIHQAIMARDKRHARTSDMILNDILAGFIHIVTQGKITGQVNGLAVLTSGETGFGFPLRITATAHPGSKGVVDIEREVKLGQAVHSKGVLILSGYLCGRYAHDFTLAMSANIAIEQSYGFIDGDSASMAEVCALKSSLTQLPMRQDIALTGSLSQFGEAQAIGGVNEKIEGFFDICVARGLTGEQGVIIPKQNQINLMLAERVIQAVEQGSFHVYAVEHVDEAMQILTGVEAGELQPDGCFPQGTINQRLVEKLRQFAG